MAQGALAAEYGQSLTVTDVKERLIQNADPLTLLLWPPNLFAFTSYVLHLSGAYQLVVSPPPGDATLNHWPPTVALLEEVLGRLEQIPDTGNRRDGEMTLAEKCKRQLHIASEWHHRFKPHNGRQPFDKPEIYKPWTFLVRWAALEWRAMFDGMTAAECDSYIGRLPIKDAAGEAEATTENFPPLLLACWKVFSDLYGLGLKGSIRTVNTLLCNDPKEAGKDVDAWHAATCLLTMHAIADDASVGWGILKNRPMPIDFPELKELQKLWDAFPDAPASWSENVQCEQLHDSHAQTKAATLLKDESTMATIAKSRSRILPKRHNPDVGITLRSLSSNLAFHHSPIEVRWERDSASDLARRLSDNREPTFTMLLLPFPMQVHTKDFKIIDGDRATEALDNRQGYGFFRYAPEEKPEQIVDEIRAVIDRAREEENPVDMVVLPEAALGVNECNALERYLTADRKPISGGEPVSAFIAGVNELLPPQQRRFDCNNTVRYGYWNGTQFETGHQHKHHRWQLGKSQIEQYGLSQKLAVGTKWWEAINVERRHVSFINIGDGMTLCPLICEDLARQDPIADLIRQVGPSLVVTILMDGPQHKDRWSSRYASILAEDPGSAVLALTSIGMVRRWNTRFGHLSRVVALWNDKEGSREIELEAGASGILLTLKMQSEPEVIADGRLEMCPTAKIFLTDVNQIYVPAVPGRRQEPSRRRNRTAFERLKTAVRQRSWAMNARSSSSATSENL